MVDGIGISKDGKSVILLISDHLAWDAAGHLDVLSVKIETYANFILSGGVTEQFAQARGKAPVVEIVHKDDPSLTATHFLESVQQQLHEVGITLTFGPLPAVSD